MDCRNRRNCRNLLSTANPKPLKRGGTEEAEGLSAKYQTPKLASNEDLQRPFFSRQLLASIGLFPLHRKIHNSPFACCRSPRKAKRPVEERVHGHFGCIPFRRCVAGLEICLSGGW